MIGKRACQVTVVVLLVVVLLVEVVLVVYLSVSNYVSCNVDALLTVVVDWEEGVEVVVVWKELAPSI